jgi:ubiquinone/menaquinone biosynthesis C-methylase UbiE
VSGPGQPGWQARARSFGAVAAEYAALRPGYPADALTFVLGSRPRRVLDLGAGTGLLSAVLRAADHEVVAVDPSPEMLAELSARFPDVEAHVGAAEQVPLPDRSVDAVVAGQAAHWFDPAPAATEIRRVLRPGGVVGLIWNSRDQRVPWVRALDDLLTSENRNSAADQRVVEVFLRLLPAAGERFESGIVQTVTPEEVVAGIGTRSYAATMDEAERATLLDRVRSLLAAHPDTRGRAQLELPYVTVAHRLVPR